MRILRWMMGIESIEKIRTEIRARVGVVNMSQKIRESGRRWFGHVERKTEEERVIGVKITPFGRSSAIPLSRFSDRMSHLFACFTLIVQRIYLYSFVGVACLDFKAASTRVST